MYGGMWVPPSPESAKKHSRNEQIRRAAHRAMQELGSFDLDKALRLPDNELMNMACRHLFDILDEEAPSEGV